MAFDNGRLKQATYDTAQGFGLRAVKDEAVGYAHASEVSEDAIRRAADSVRAVKGGYSGHIADGPARTNVRLYTDDNPLASLGFEAKVKLLEEMDAYARAKDARVRQVSASVAATWQVIEILRPDGEIYRDVRPMVRVNVSIVAGEGDRQETGSHGYGGREVYQRFVEADGVARRGRRCGAPGAGQSRVGAGAGRRDGRGARPRLARRHAARGGRPRPRRRLQPQEDVGLRRPDGRSRWRPRA